MLNTQRYFNAVHHEHIQLLFNGEGHWVVSFVAGRRIQVCNSLYNTVTGTLAASLKQLYGACSDSNGKQTITILPVQKQPDGFSCGLFAIAFAMEIMHGQSPMDAHFDVKACGITLFNV